MRFSTIAVFATAVLLGSSAAGLAEPATTPDAAATAAPATAPATGMPAAGPASTTAPAPAAQATPAAAPAPSATAQADPNPIVCRTETVTGSRLGTKRICAHESEWKTMREDSRHSMAQWESHNPPPRGN